MPMAKFCHHGLWNMTAPRWQLLNAVVKSEGCIHKQEDKRNVKNYWLASLLPIFRKIFEHLIDNEMFSFFIENDLTSSN